MVWQAIAMQAGTKLLGGILDSNRQNEADQRAWQNQQAQNAYQAQIAKMQTQASNRHTKKDYWQAIKDVRTQFALNETAATRAFSNEQWKYNETVAKAAFTRNELEKELLNLIGSQLASSQGRTSSKSLDRANLVNSLGEFGRSAMLLNKSLTSARTQTERKMGSIAGQHHQSDMNAYSRIAVPPMLAMHAGSGPQLQAPKSRSGFNLGSLAMAGLGAAAGYQTQYSLGGGEGFFWNS